MLYAERLQPVGAAAALRSHSQGGYCDECIQDERTTLRQALRSNGTCLSSAVTLAVTRRPSGNVSTLLTPRTRPHEAFRASAEVGALVAPYPRSTASTGRGLSTVRRGNLECEMAGVTQSAIVA